MVFFPQKNQVFHFFPHKYYVGVEWERKLSKCSLQTEQRPLPHWFSPAIKGLGSPRNVNFYFECHASYKQASKAHFPVACQVSFSRTVLGKGSAWEHSCLLPFYLILRLLSKFSNTVFCGYGNCCSQRLSKLPRPWSR